MRVSAIPQAASVLLVRGHDPVEVFAVRRSESLRFFGGFVAFPGGKITPADAAVRIISEDSEPPRRTDLQSVPPEQSYGRTDCKSVLLQQVAAIRELFEETGILIARSADGTFPASSPEFDRHRHDLIEGLRSFDQSLTELGLVIRASDLAYLGRLVTPPFTATRFDTAFFLAQAPAGQRPEVWPGELQDGFWATPDALLQRWARGELMVSPPSVAILQTLRGRPLAEVAPRLGSLFQSLEDGKLHSIYFAPAVQLIPLRTQSLPPSTHTNAYLVGTGPTYLLDPGPSDPEEQAKLFEVLDEHAAAGRPLTAVVLTHHHPDHVGAVNACIRRFGVPTWAHPLTARALEGKIVVSRFIQGGDQLDLGTLPDGSGRWYLQALHTPGHAAGHLAFFEPHFGLLFAGDMISTQSSVVIAPPNGDLTEYLASLRRLQTLPIRQLLPAHGGATARARQVLEEALSHRAKREEMLLEALSKGPRTVSDLAREMYRGVPDELMRFANMQVQAGLIKLQREGRARTLGDGPEAEWCGNDEFPSTNDERSPKPQ
jgi:glyoxylase-like metal-dependent hydrolase (beta-lactamase superfamily II)/8-oxo-dGTP pyrophosphatase MutT (NUDIX family)